MARRRRTPRIKATTAADLDRRLSLLSWLLSRLGYATAKDMLDDMGQADEGYDDEGRSRFCVRLISRESQMRGINRADLERYDDNIRAHLNAMNASRALPITLRYFQYLAALCAEIYLERLSASPAALLQSINAHAISVNSNRRIQDHLDIFEESDLKKLAFWMATGSGKTLLMHLNYRQYLHYNREPPENILLITPNEGLSRQHLADLQESGIPAERLDISEPNLFQTAPNAVKVTEITKLVLEKRGEGETVLVEDFEGNNLVFVDEGHRGSGGETWFAVRDILGRDGFTFEYSATFGQALITAGDPALLSEYGKAIGFDYSYRHFYSDGYGKDFNIVNLTAQTDADRTDQLLLANALTFYQQQLVFSEQRDALRDYNLERPLWIFVGGTVTGGARVHSDLLTAVRFMNRLLLNQNWATESIEALIGGQSGLRDELGNDVFRGRFNYLRQSGQDANAIYRDMLEKIFHAPSGGALRLYDIPASKGEIGLKVGNSDDYFGVIYVGDDARFRNFVRNNAPEIDVLDDQFAGSLFDTINQPNSPIQTLIGSRKFNEGWNSWRVSSMGLLNIGTSEGSQIIQLFGRGVRLRGRDMSLKRSEKVAGSHPENIKLLETLDIFGVRADYMTRFREYLEREGVPTQSEIELPLFVKPNPDFLNKGLVIPRLPDDAQFDASPPVALEPDPSVRVSLDVSARAQRLVSNEDGHTDDEAASGQETRISAAALDLLDWDDLRRELIQRARDKGMTNLVMTPDALRRIMEADEPAAYTLTADDGVANPATVEDLLRLREAALGILGKYADALYRNRNRKWESDNMIYKPLDEHDANLNFNISDAGKGRYIVTVPASNDSLVKEIQRLIQNCNDLYRMDSPYADLPRIHFDRHIYQPLLIDGNPDVKLSPPGLVKSEQEFVEGLRRYWRNNHESHPEADLFLLRNQARGAGVGFFNREGYYPDFILWIKTPDSQRIVFVEPHGMGRANAYDEDDGATLHERLPDLARAIAQRSPAATNISLDSFIVSATPYDDLRQTFGDGRWSRADFAAKHILFPETTDDYNYIREILKDPN